MYARAWFCLEGTQARINLERHLLLRIIEETEGIERLRGKLGHVES